MVLSAANARTTRLRSTLRARPGAAVRIVAAHVVCAALLAAPAWAQSVGSPVGLWKNIDDETKEAKALIRITETDGAFVGRIERILTDRVDAVCDLCTDERKDRPVQGMQILDGMRRDADQPDRFDGGRILDPSNGKVYRSQMRLIDDGRRLEVRGYIGAPLFGRTQTWVREP